MLVGKDRLLVHLFGVRRVGDMGLNPKPGLGAPTLEDNELALLYTRERARVKSVPGATF